MPWSKHDEKRPFASSFDAAARARIRSRADTVRTLGRGAFIHRRRRNIRTRAHEFRTLSHGLTGTGQCIDLLDRGASL